MRDFRFEDLLKSYRARMARLGWTQEKVAEKLSVGKRTYQGWEAGEYIPSNEMLQRIASLFELSDTEADELYRTASQVAPEIHNLPFPRNLFFTGRETYLEQLDRHLKENGSVEVTQPISISGLGGVGKTQLALEYAHRCYSKVYRTILWANAANKVTLEESYLSLARILKLPEKDEREIDRVVQAVKMWLEGHTSWLLILDNADDLQLTRTFFPVKPCGHILLTTRSQIVGNIAFPIMVEAMEPEEGLRFLLRRSGILNRSAEPEILASDIREAARQLVELLGGHPLALDQAGSYIEETGASFNMYVQLYHEERRILLNERGSLGGEHPETVAVTFEVSFQHACEVCPLAADVLSFCAFLHPDAIPEELLSHDESLKLNAMTFDKAIVALRCYSLIKRNSEERMLSIHRLVQAVIRDGMDEGSIEQWAERVIAAMATVIPEAEPVTWESCARLLPHALVYANHTASSQRASEDLALLLYKTANYLFDRAQYTEAESLYQRALRISEQAYGPDYSLVAFSLKGLAELYQEQGKYAEAEPLYQRALHIWEQAHGPDNPNVALSLNGLANLYREQGKYAEAESLYQQALHIWKQAYGPDNPLVAYPLNGLALLYQEQGKYAEAEPLYQRALHILEHAHNPNHPDVAYPLNDLANLYREQGKYAEAEPLYQRVLSICESRLGPQHPETAEVVHSFAAFQYAQGNRHKAKSLFQRALAIRELSLKQHHPKTIETRKCYITLLRETGQQDEAAYLEAFQSIQAQAEEA